MDSSDEDLKITNTPLMLGFCEIILILWKLNEDTLKKESNAQYKKAIEKKFSYALPEMLHTFSVSVYLNYETVHRKSVELSVQFSVHKTLHSECFCHTLTKFIVTCGQLFKASLA